MRIGINASFLRKPGTGIGQVTFNFVRVLAKLREVGIRDQGSGKNSQFSILNSQFILYCADEPDLPFPLPEHFQIKVFLPWWKRDDVPRKLLWERELKRRAKNDECDVFLSLYQSATVFEEGFPHVMVVHDLIPFLFPEYTGTLSRRLYQKAVGRGMECATHIISVSEATKKDLMAFGIAGEKITTAYPGVSETFSQRLSREEVDRVLEKFKLSRGYIYHGGGLEKRKNTEGVLRAYACLFKEEGQTLPPLVISGRVFSEKNGLATPVRSLVRDLGLEKKVVVTDFLPEKEIHALYQGALFFVYPSLYEGFGLPVLEAEASGVPVITSRNSSLLEVGGSGALFVNPENIPNLTAAMKHLLKDASLRETLLSKGRVHALQFNWQTFTKAILTQLLRTL